MSQWRAKLGTELLGIAVVFAAGGPASAQVAPAYDVRAHYEKREYTIPMRDGVKLFTSVYTPRDRSRNYPLLLNRTPYSVAPYGADAYARSLGPAARFAEADYIFVSQDVRGRNHSEGHFVHMTPQKDVKRGAHDVDESSDTYDTIDWLLKNIPHNNGRAGLWGISYGGFYAAAGLIGAHPALKAVSPQAPQTDWFLGDDTHHNGAFFLTSTFNFMASCGRLGTASAMSCGPRFDFGDKDGYDFFLGMGSLAEADAKYFHGQVPGWTEMMEHGTYDQFWRDRNILPHVKRVKPAVLTVGGWYDANNFYGALHLYEAIERQSPGTDNAIVIGPWSHGQWARDAGSELGVLRFGSNTGTEYRDEVLLPFFEHHLKGRPAGIPARARVFETGANRWREFASWPPKQAVSRSYYLGAGGSLSATPARRGLDTTDRYVSDPSHPVPFVPLPSTDMDPAYMAEDQRFGANRPDVLVYQGEPVTEEVTIAGPVQPTLFVATTGTDGDWIVKVIDVHPDGTQELVRGDVTRAKFRRSFEKPEPLVPGRVARLDFVMPDVFHTFGTGHRIMVQVQSSWFPLVDRNPQTFVDIYRASASDFRSATQQVFRSAAQASRVTFRVLPTARTP